MLPVKHKKLLPWETPVPWEAMDKKRRGLFAGGVVLALLIAALISSGWLMRPSSAGWNGATNTGWYNAASSDLYISTSADLAGLAELVNSDDGRVSFDNQTIHLLNDIDLESAEWTPIGNDVWKSFAGTFDGHGHSITNLKVTAREYAGLFGQCANATIKNLTVTGSVKGDAQSDANGTGGVVGYMLDSSVENCVNKAEISGNMYVGGVVGKATYYHNSKSSVTNCVNEAPVTGTADYVGGIAGYTQAEASSCTNSGAISGNNYVGGIAGYTQAEASNCTNSGAVSGNNYVGGIAGYTQAEASNCTNSGAISGNSSIGGIAGDLGNTNITNNLNLGNVTAKDSYAGGIVGGEQYNNSHISISNCVNQGLIAADYQYAGGIAGYINKGSITSSFSTGAVTAQQYAGALVGCNPLSVSSASAPAVTLSASNCGWYVSGTVNKGLQAINHDDSTYSNDGCTSTDNYSNIVMAMTVDPGALTMPQGSTRTILRTWPGTNADAVSSLNGAVISGTAGGLALSKTTDWQLRATLNAAGSYVVSADFSYTPTKLVAKAISSPDKYSVQNMTMTISERTGSWPASGDLRVVPHGSGDGSGSSWENAMSGVDMLDMLTAKSADTGLSYNIWVKGGTYELTKTLPLTKGVKLYGGFAGNETKLTDRSIADIAANKTVLSRDASVSSDVKFSIVTGGAGATSADTKIDGFTITGGNGTVVVEENNYTYNHGGGMYNKNSSPAVTNCTFSNNTIIGFGNGGGMYNMNCSPTVTNCIFSSNSVSVNNGGGMYNESNPTITNCTFINNKAATNGGGICNEGSSPEITSCSFISNEARGLGGGIYSAQEAAPVVTNCTFAGNKASKGGGATNSSGGNPVFVNCTFSGNSTTTDGVGMYNYWGINASIINCIFRDELSGDKAEIYNDGYSGDNASGTITIKNTVIQGMAIKTNGTGLTIVSADVTSAAPMLLQTTPADNGGPVPTIAISAHGSAFRKGLKPGAQTIDDKTITIPAADARGVSFDSTNADIGAYSWQTGNVTKITPASNEIYLGEKTEFTVDIAPVSTAVEDKGLVPSLVNLHLTSSPTDILTISGDTGIAGSKAGTAIIKADGYSPESRVLVRLKPENLGDNATVTAATSTDRDNSGVLAVNDAKDSLAIKETLADLATKGMLPSGISSTDARAIDALSRDITTGDNPFTKEAVKTAIKNYEKTDENHNLLLVNMVNTVTDSGDTLWGKFWKLVRSLLGIGESTSDYLPLQTNFTVSSQDIPAAVKGRISQANSEALTAIFLENIELYAVVKSNDSSAERPAARSLSDMVTSADIEKYITVSRDASGDYHIATRVLLFNQQGSVSASASAQGAPFAMPFTPKSGDSALHEKDNYFLIQDGCGTDDYMLCMALAAKTPRRQYVSKDGAGIKDGSGWNNAMTAQAFITELKRTATDGIVTNNEYWVASGDYLLKETLPLTKGV